MRYWHSTLSQHSLYAFILNLGLCPGDLLAEAKLPASAFINSGGWIERDTALQLLRSLRESTGDPLIGLHQSAFFRFDEFGLWGQGILSSSTLGDALDFASREICCMQTGTRIHCARAGSRVRVAVVFDGALGCDPKWHEQSHLALLRMILDLCEQKVLADVSVACADLSQRDEFELLFGPQLQFDKGKNYLEFDASALGFKIGARTREEPAGRPGFGRNASMVGRTALDLVRDVICYERPSIRSISDALGLNLRAFQRQLDVLGLTFRHLVDEYRQACGLADLSEGRLSVIEIAFRLGYSDSAHFTRAVRRWTGSSPRELQGRPIPAQHWANSRFKFIESTDMQREMVYDKHRMTLPC